MNVSIFGATGALGKECVVQCLEAGHTVTVLARTPSKLPKDLRYRVEVIRGDALDPEAVASVIDRDTDAILFAIGVDRASPEDLCTDVTRHIIAAMYKCGVNRFVWCGGGSNIVEGDVVTFGSRFVEFFASHFLGLRHRDKAHQLDLLDQHKDLAWIGARPLQMRNGARRGEYRLGFHAYSGLSKITFADCAHAMVGMLEDDTWLNKAPIIQY
jgi:putative NADH-flavin reductase